MGSVTVDAALPDGAGMRARRDPGPPKKPQDQVSSNRSFFGTWIDYMFSVFLYN